MTKSETEDWLKRAKDRWPLIADRPGALDEWYDVVGQYYTRPQLDSAISWWSARGKKAPVYSDIVEACKSLGFTQQNEHLEPEARRIERYRPYNAIEYVMDVMGARVVEAELRELFALDGLTFLLRPFGKSARDASQKYKAWLVSAVARCREVQAPRRDFDDSRWLSRCLEDV